MCRQQLQFYFNFTTFQTVVNKPSLEVHLGIGPNALSLWVAQEKNREGPKTLWRVRLFDRSTNANSKNFDSNLCSKNTEFHQWYWRWSARLLLFGFWLSTQDEGIMVNVMIYSEGPSTRPKHVNIPSANVRIFPEFEKPTNAQRCQNKLRLVSDVLCLFVFIVPSFDLSWMPVEEEKGHLIVELLSPNVNMKRAATQAFRQESEEVFKRRYHPKCAVKCECFFTDAFILDVEVKLQQNLVSAEHFRLLRPGQLSNCTSTPTHRVNTHHWQTASTLNCAERRVIEMSFNLASCWLNWDFNRTHYNLSDSSTRRLWASCTVSIQEELISPPPSPGGKEEQIKGQKDCAAERNKRCGIAINLTIR